jgi:hypothetical protein
MRLPKYWIAIGVAAVVVIAAGVGYAAIPDNNGVIHACMLKATGTIRLIDTSLGSQSLRGHCTALETEVSWSQQGPKGDPGLQGAAGPRGDPGSPLSSTDALNGLQCHRRGIAGTVGLFDSGAPLAYSFDLTLNCITPDGSEPNDTRATETTLNQAGPVNPERTLYPAGDDDWYLIVGGFPNPSPTSVSAVGAFQLMTGADSAFNAPMNVEIYQDGTLVASGDGHATFSGGTGHTYEVHVSGAGPALYYFNGF